MSGGTLLQPIGRKDGLTGQQVKDGNDFGHLIQPGAHGAGDRLEDFRLAFGRPRPLSKRQKTAYGRPLAIRALFSRCREAVSHLFLKETAILFIQNGLRKASTWLFLGQPSGKPSNSTLGLAGSGSGNTARCSAGECRIFCAMRGLP